MLNQTPHQEPQPHNLPPRPETTEPDWLAQLAEEGFNQAEIKTLSDYLESNGPANLDEIKHLMVHKHSRVLTIAEMKIIKQGLTSKLH